MKRTQVCLSHRFFGRRFDRSLSVRPIAVGALALMLGLGAIGAPPHATATPLCAHAAVQQPTVTVYLYDTDNTPEPTPDAYIEEGGVYTDTGFVGTLNANDQIVNSANVIIGYVTVAMLR